MLVDSNPQVFEGLVPLQGVTVGCQRQALKLGELTWAAINYEFALGYIQGQWGGIKPLA